MARILFLVPKIKKNTFSGGLLTIFEYANGLFERGNEVSVMPLAPSSYPAWFNPKFDILFPRKNRTLISFCRAVLKRDLEKLGQVLTKGFTAASRWANYSFQRASHLELARLNLPVADITISTSYQTALPNFLYGSGKKFYFVQHFEPYFSIDFENQQLAYWDALSSYFLDDLQIIANSSWLSKKIAEHNHQEIPVCVNAIQQDDFYPDRTLDTATDAPIVISYGGRKAKWKGIFDAAKAIRLARKKVPKLQWHVYGDSLLRPGNDIAPYVSLGFIAGAKLRRAYSNSDILLSASWYESFPLFPLEAMACGLAVVSTPYGLEDYLEHQKNGIVVEAKNPESMAAAIIDLCQKTELRRDLARQAMQDAKCFTWKRSVQRMAELIRAG
jgi:glycosyltransferase involved in cell wall biosynthesis